MALQVVERHKCDDQSIKALVRRREGARSGGDPFAYLIQHCLVFFDVVSFKLFIHFYITIPETLSAHPSRPVYKTGGPGLPAFAHHIPAFFFGGMHFEIFMF